MFQSLTPTFTHLFTLQYILLCAKCLTTSGRISVRQFCWTYATKLATSGYTWTFQHDTDPQHRAMLTTWWMWPSQFPNFKIIEQLWEISNMQFMLNNQRQFKRPGGFPKQHHLCNIWYWEIRVCKWFNRNISLVFFLLLCFKKEPFVVVLFWVSGVNVLMSFSDPKSTIFRQLYCFSVHLEPAVPTMSSVSPSNTFFKNREERGKSLEGAMINSHYSLQGEAVSWVISDLWSLTSI